jgi:methylenetetrahydrofolate dehydrogenase (NADP+)/methenyltetrahydrofolate cyclohydrolase
MSLATRRWRAPVSPETAVGQPDDQPVDTYILKGSRLAKRLRAEIVASQQHLLDLGGRTPRLASVMVGRDGAAEAYRSSIERTFGRVQLDNVRVELPGDSSPAAFLDALREINRDDAITAVLVLMPLPGHLDPHLVLEHLSPLKDVDGITPTNAGRLYLGLPSLRPSTPQGGIELLDYYDVPIAGRRAVVIGRSPVVGRPLAMLLTQRDATVTLCHRTTPDLAEFTRAADLVALAAGSPDLLTGEMIRPGAVVVDFGVTVVDAHLRGDADEESVAMVAGAYTPVPGGTGPVTTAVLARNTVAAAFASLLGSLDESDGLVGALPTAAGRAASS